MKISFEEQFKFLKDRAHSTDLQYIDEAMRPVCEHLNKYDNLATVWCCSGHKKEQNGKAYTLPYLALVSEDSNLTAVDLLMHLVDVWECTHADKHKTPMSFDVLPLFAPTEWGIGDYYQVVSFYLVNRKEPKEGKYFTHGKVDEDAWEYIQDEFFDFLIEESENYFKNKMLA